MIQHLVSSKKQVAGGRLQVASGNWQVKVVRDELVDLSISTSHPGDLRRVSIWVLRCEYNQCSMDDFKCHYFLMYQTKGGSAQGMTAVPTE